MKKASRFLIVLTVVLICGSAWAIHQTMPSETMVPLPPADGQKLFEYITMYNSYKAWNLLPGTEEYTKGEGIHGGLVTIRLNSKAYFSLKKGTPLADTSIAVIEGYDIDRQLKSISVMYKIEGYNPSAGDWFWANYSAGGEVMESGKTEACLNCHLEMKENDYLFARASG